MYLLAIDDFIFSQKGIYPALITDRSSHLNFGVDRRSGLHSSVYFGSSAQAASWHVIIQVPNEETWDALIAVLAAMRDAEVRLLAQRDTAGADLVTIDAAVSSVEPHGSSWNVEVQFESNDSIWTGVTPVQVSKTFADPRDQIIHLPAPGNVPTQPTLRLTPTAQRSASTSAVGWRYRQRIAVINGSDEPWFRYPVLIPLGDTAALVADDKALASGADLRVWLHGLEQSRTLVDWNTPESGCWVIVPALPPGEALTYEIVYGNPLATLGDGVDLVYPEAPAFDLLESDNYQHHYPAERDLANAAMGLWWLSSPLEGGTADVGIPGAWAPALTFENPSNSDTVVQPRAQRVREGGREWYQALLYASRWKGPGYVDVEAYQGSDPYDGVVLYSPLGIRAVVCDGIRWRNDAALKTTVTTTVGNVSETTEVLVPHAPYTRVVVLGRNSGGEQWHVLTEYGQAVGAGAESRLYLPSSGAAPISPAFAGDWGDTGSADRVAAVAVKGVTPMADKTTAFTAYGLGEPAAYTLDTTFGASGSGDTQFYNPGQMACDASGAIYIADMGNDRVKKHDAGGAFIAEAADSGAAGVCVDAAGYVYTAYSSRVRRYDSALATFTTIYLTGTITGLASNGTEVFAVTSAIGGAKIWKIDPVTGSASTFGTLPSVSTPRDIAYGNGRLYIVSAGGTPEIVSTPISVFTPTSWGASGSDDGEFLDPTSVTVNPIDGNVLVTDQGRDDVQTFTPGGIFVRKHAPGAGPGPGQLSNPNGLAFAPSGRKLYVAEAGNNRVTILDAEWDFAGQDLLARQYVYPLAAGVEFSTADTVTGQARAATAEGTKARAQLVIRVVTADGTVRATLLGIDGAAMANDFANTLTDRAFPRDAPVNLETNYTTVAGDYLVLEYGARFGEHSVTVPGVTLRFGDVETNDLPENETETADFCPWVEFSTELFPNAGNDIHTEAATWTPPRPVKHFGVAVWPKGGVSIPDNAESRVLVESDGDITVHIAAESLVITRIEDEVEIYELATELRLHGGGNAVGPYDTLLVGNARGLAGPGTPRAAVVLSQQGLQIDTERHTHTLWDTGYTTQTEALPAHAVRALRGVLREIDAADIPALERIPAGPANGTFASDLTGWELDTDDADWSYTVTHDPAVGGAGPGSLRFTVAAADPATVLWRSTGYQAVEPGDAVEATCWVRQTDSGATAPRLGVAWYDATPDLLGVALNAASEIPLNPATDHALAFAGAAPEGATQFRVVVGVTAVADAPGSKWFDDVAAAIIRPLRYDGSTALVTEETRSSRWLPVAPARRAVPNGDFATDIAEWALEDDGTGVDYTVARDGGIGGDANGALRIWILGNPNTDAVMYRTTGFFAVNGADQVEMSAWVYTSGVFARPRLAILWYGDANDTVLATSWEPTAALPPGVGCRRSFAAIVPPGMTRFRLALVAEPVESPGTASVFFDDVRLNDNDLRVADVAMGEIDVMALVPPRWTP